MSREIPEVVRAAAGLAATVLDEARRLPETLPGLPVRVIGLAMQHAMKVQQQYAGFVARGDELFTGIRGKDEPGLATFDDDVEPVTVAPPGFRDSAFDRAAETSASDPTTYAVTDDDVDDLSADAVAVAAVEELADQAEDAQTSLDDLAAEAPTTDEVLDEIAIDELVDQAPTLDETAPTAADTLDAEPTADVATTVDVLTPDGEVTTVDATVTDEGIAAPEAGDSTATDEGGTPVAAATGVRTDVGETGTAEEDAAIAEGAAVDAVGETTTEPTDDAAGGSELSGSQAAGAAPIDGYDGFSVAQLRGRLRGYALSTVQDLLAYEEATRARAPYLKMLRNRLEKLEEQAIASSPLAPRRA
jgi:hypothetical protein